MLQNQLLRCFGAAAKSASKFTFPQVCTTKSHEKFNNYYIRIDILERLFLLIFNSEKDGKKEVKVVPEMLNLLGCSKENFKKLLKKMGYKIYEKEKEFFIKYLPSKKRIFKGQDKKDYSNNPFSILNQLNLK